MDKIKSIKAKFKDKNIFDVALTHRSWVNEHPGVREHNERLEFLGDAVVELVVSQELFKKFPQEKEGFLTNLRSQLVNTVNLAQVARKIGIGSELFISKGEEESGGRSNLSLLANSVEALIGAIYIDQGVEAASEFIKANLISDISIKLSQPLKDAKSRLQEMVQSRGLNAPKYRVRSESGPDHAKNFEVEVVIDGETLGSGIGRSKAEAEQEAAKVALVKFKSKG